MLRSEVEVRDQMFFPLAVDIMESACKKQQKTIILMFGTVTLSVWGIRLHVCNQEAYADNLINVVDQILIKKAISKDIYGKRCILAPRTSCTDGLKKYNIPVWFWWPVYWALARSRDFLLSSECVASESVSLGSGVAPGWCAVHPQSRWSPSQLAPGGWRTQLGGSWTLKWRGQGRSEKFKIFIKMLWQTFIMAKVLEYLIQITVKNLDHLHTIPSQTGLVESREQNYWVPGFPRHPKIVLETQNLDQDFRLETLRKW